MNIENEKEEVLVFENDYFQEEDDTIKLKPIFILKEWKNEKNKKDLLQNNSKSL